MPFDGWRLGWALSAFCQTSGTQFQGQSRQVHVTHSRRWVPVHLCHPWGLLFFSLSFALREAIEKFRDEMCVLLLKRKKLTCAELFENNSALNWVSLTSGDSEAVTKGFIWSQKCEHFCPFPYPSQHRLTRMLFCSAQPTLCLVHFTAWPIRCPELDIPLESLEMGTLMCCTPAMRIHSGRCHGCVSSSLREHAERTQDSGFQQVPKAETWACHWDWANAEFLPSYS